MICAKPIGLALTHFPIMVLIVTSCANCHIIKVTYKMVHQHKHNTGLCE